MEYPYSKEEREARRQFFQLFCGNYLYECEEEDSISDQPWSADVLCEILHNMYPDNPLTPNDIQSITYQVGMIPLNTDQMYFGYRWQSGTTTEIIAAISPYIANDVYLKLMHTLRGAVVDSFMEFYTSCCTNYKVPVAKVSIKRAYALYEEWCKRNTMDAVSKKSFISSMRRAGHRTMKGYAEGQSGVNYFMVSLDEEVIHVQKQKTPKQHPIWTSFGRGNKSSEEVTRGQEETVSTSQSEYEGQTGEDFHYAGTSEDLSSNGSARETIRTIGFEPTRDEYSGGAAHRAPQDGNVGFQSATEGPGDEPERDIKWRVKHLPPDIREAFTEMKVMCRASVKKPTREEFEADCVGWGVEATQELYDLFLEYLG